MNRFILTFVFFLPTIAVENFNILSKEQLNNVFQGINGKVQNQPITTNVTESIIKNSTNLNIFSKKQLKDCYYCINNYGLPKIDEIQNAINLQDFLHLMFVFANGAKIIKAKQKLRYQALAEKKLKEAKEFYIAKKLTEFEKSKIGFYKGTLSMLSLSNFLLVLNDFRNINSYKKNLFKNFFLSTVPNIIPSIVLLYFSKTKVKNIRDNYEGAKDKYETALAISQYIDELPVNVEIKNI
ncbi:hypothetical protein M1446_04920 [Candidatus Dependentiae bacterium]|nr:hypothetical protein [Candidatus Dependentiae bacterium]